MATSIDYTAEFPVDVERLHGALTDRDYWAARVLAISGEDATVEFGPGPGEHVGMDWFSVRTSHRLTTDELPPALAKFRFADLTLFRNEHWGPVFNGTATGWYSVSIPGTPLDMRGDMKLVPIGSGSGIRYTGELKLKVPLLATKLESFFSAQLIDLIGRVRTFTLTWLTSH